MNMRPLIMLLTSLIFPYWLPQNVYAESLEFSPSADLLYDEEYQSAFDHDGEGLFYAGKYLWNDQEIISRGLSALILVKFQGHPLKNKLDMYVVSYETAENQNLYLDVWGSSNNLKNDTDTNFPEWDKTGYVRKDSSEIAS